MQVRLVVGLDRGDPVIEAVAVAAGEDLGELGDVPGKGIQVRAALCGLRELGFLVDPTNASSADDTEDIEAAANTLGLKLLTLKASSEGELDTAFATFSKQPIDAVVVAAEAFFLSRRDHVVALAARYSFPSMYHLREMAAAGGLVSYGTNIGDSYRQAGIYCGRILEGEKPVDLPVMQSTKFDFVINLKTAKALGLNVPPALLAIADEVIE